MNYQEAVAYIHARPKFSRVLGNDMLRKLLERLGSPQKQLKCIHIAGTNGKGSTAAMIETVLRHAGYKTGLFTSPFIEIFNERIQVNGQMISDEDLAQTVTAVCECMEKYQVHVSEFAFILAVAFVYFRQQACEFVILETGMGGKLDATNVIDSSFISILTLIGMDHMQYLGNTIEEIARTKCGIIKEHGEVVSYPEQRESVKRIIEAVCREKHAKLFAAEPPVITENGFLYHGEPFSVSLSGTYQIYNAAVVIEAARCMERKGVCVRTEDIQWGLAHTVWKARFERIDDTLILDGSHNLDGMRALKQSLRELNRPVILVLAMMKDKQYDACIAEIAPLADLVVATEVNGMDRTLEAEKTAEIAARYTSAVIKRDCIEAVQYALEQAGSTSAVCTCGSLYLAGLIRNNLHKIKS